MNDLLMHIKTLVKADDYKEVCAIITEKLKNEINDINLLIILARIIVAVPIVDYEMSIAYLQKALSIEPNNPLALIVITHVYEYEMGGIDDMLLHRIKNLNTNSNETNAMLKYVASWSYRDHKKNFPEMEEQLLKESIDLCNTHVWNYVHLAELYTQQQRYLEVNPLIHKALHNIQKIYTNKNMHEHDSTNINDFINSRIKGTHITDSNVTFIRETLVPKYIIIIYWIITPFLNLYHFIKAKILD